ncbi:MAG: hypothetical protein GWN88_06815, partial [Nitrospinaceae bacterium]|nr:hypothetical protein [Nitrospinaceae bacterium]NIU43918.1 hypothetical protein [Nitrospinaceae bacterium]NIU96034.1 hypothetical protein [Nitrospinaceae bacterium]NIW05509.1 hypothetical protein [Nitrospinaceae bacterium]NIW58684.1 hypothetical protein [Nitrospinaceae bacterium]
MNTLKLSENGSQNAVLFDVRANPPFRGQFEPFAEQVLEWEEQGKRVALVAPTKGQVRRVHELMDEYGVTLDVDLGYISSGFQMEGFDRVFVA